MAKKNLITNSLVRNKKLGQVWTPDHIALKMAQLCLKYRLDIQSVLDPACGPATFSRALYKAGLVDMDLTCYDIDVRMQDITMTVHQQLGIKGTVYARDYMNQKLPSKPFDLVIMNPPYIRHEDIEASDKNSYHTYLADVLDEKIDRRSNLFALFLLKGLSELAPNGILCTIVYDAINQSAYGEKTLKILNRYAQILERHHITTPFEGVLIDAQILIYQKRLKPLDTLSKISGSDSSNEGNENLVELEQLLHIQRGTALPLRRLFIAQSDDPYFDYSIPFFIKQTNLTSLNVKADQRAYLLKDLVTNEKNLIETDFDEIYQWLTQRVKDHGRPSYRVEIAGVRGPILFNYYIRNAERHLWNEHNIAVSDNFYVSTPKFEFNQKVAWLLLNSRHYLNRIKQAARSQGNGLLKLQLYEYRQVKVPDWRILDVSTIAHLYDKSSFLIEKNADSITVQETADKVTQGVFT